MSRQYLNASKAVGSVRSGTPLKRYCAKVKIGKEEYALACETLKYSDVLDRICKAVSVTARTLDVDENLFHVMLYEILFGKGKIKSGGVVKRRIMENADKFMSGLHAEMAEKGTENKFDLLSEDILVSENIPKYIRINSIKSSISSGVAELSIFTGTQMTIDIHIPSLVSIPANKAAGLNRHDGVLTGRFIMQDKASCFPSQILHDEWAEIKSRTNQPVDMIDSCAAPGNKTSHLSASSFQADITGNDMKLDNAGCRKGEFLADIFAFDRSVERAQLLQSRMDAAGAKNVHVCNADFLEVNVSDPKYRYVRALLVDPSCSGSGVVRSLERALERTVSAASGMSSQGPSCNQQDDRLRKLSQFQISVVTKAMSFPAAEAVAYSTCSVHVEENENVVSQLLANHPDWDVKLPPRFASWPRRGLEGVYGLSTEQASRLIRCSPEDGMNGFFVALFVKKTALYFVRSSTHQCQTDRDYEISLKEVVQVSSESSKSKEDGAVDNNTSARKHNRTDEEEAFNECGQTSASYYRKRHRMRIWTPLSKMPLW